MPDMAVYIEQSAQRFGWSDATKRLLLESYNNGVLGNLANSLSDYYVARYVTHAHGRLLSGRTRTGGYQKRMISIALTIVPHTAADAAAIKMSAARKLKQMSRPSSSI